MIFRDNPVLIRRVARPTSSPPRAFVLQFLYVVFLGVFVLLRLARQAEGQQVGSRRGAAAVRPRTFLDQFFLVALIAATTFRAGSITGEKERKTYEMLLASPLQPVKHPHRPTTQLADISCRLSFRALPLVITASCSAAS